MALIELPQPKLFLAGKTFVRYRRQGCKKNNVLADFFMGAHAAVSECPILTRDPKQYAAYVPSVGLISPTSWREGARSARQFEDSLAEALGVVAGGVQKVQHAFFVPSF